MKKMIAFGLVLAALSGIARPAAAEGPAMMPAASAGMLASVPAEQAKDWIGKEAVIEGVVTGARHIEQGDKQPVFLNFGEPFPKHAFTVVIFGKDRAKFGDVPPEKLFDGKRIRVRGKVEEFKGRPQIVIDDPAKIEIVPDVKPTP